MSAHQATSLDPLLTEEQVEAQTGISRSTLRSDRHRGVGLPYVRVTERRIRYRASDITDYLDGRTVRP